MYVQLLTLKMWQSAVQANFKQPKLVLDITGTCYTLQLTASSVTQSYEFTLTFYWWKAVQWYASSRGWNSESQHYH